MGWVHLFCAGATNFESTPAKMDHALRGETVSMMRRTLPLVLMLLVSSSLGQAENDASGELSTYTGILMGMGTRAAVGGTSGLIYPPYFIAFVDFAFSPVGTETIRPIVPAGVKGARLYDFSVGADVQIPVHRRWKPYGILAASVLCNTYEPVSTGRQSAYFGFQTGGGVRYFIADKWGVRSELKVIISQRTFTRLGFGIFYQFSDSIGGH